MNNLITINLDDRPDVFTYQGRFFRKIAEDYDSANFNIVIDETFGYINDSTFQLPVPLHTTSIAKLDNATAQDLTSIYVQSPEYDEVTRIALVDPFIDATMIEIIASQNDSGDVEVLFNKDTKLTTPGDIYQTRIKGVLYNITYYGIDYQTDIVGSAAFKIAPTTESLLKTGDYNLISTIAGDAYIDIIDSSIIS